MKLSKEIFVVSLILLWPAVHSCGAQITAQRVRSALDRGVKYLKREQLRRGDWKELSNLSYGGVTALCTLALLEAGVPTDDSSIQRSLAYLRNEQSQRTYSASLRIMVYCRAGTVGDRAMIRALVQELQDMQITKQGKSHGGWGYPAGVADNSNSQFAMLALYEAEQAGFEVSAHVWQAALEYWRRCQNADGSWGYHHGTPGSASMTCAGLSSLVIALESQVGDGAQIVDGSCSCSALTDDKAIQRGLRWLGSHFSVTQNRGGRGRVGERSNYLYYMYGLERVGRVTAQRFFVTPQRQGPGIQHDWYREGAEQLLKKQLQDGSWKIDIPDAPHIGSSMAVLFLSKGRRPVLISKLKRQESDWNHLRHDLKHLTQYTERKWKLPMTWQVIDSAAATADDYLQTPVLFISGEESFQFTPRQQQELRRYVEQGGFILADRCCQPPGVDPFADGFGKSFRDEMRKIFPEPGSHLKQLDPQHPIWSIDERVDPQFINPNDRWIWGIDFACRTSVVYCPGNLSCYWELDSVRRRKQLEPPISDEIAACRAIGVNILSYATGRKLKTKDAVPVSSLDSGPKSEQPGGRGHFAMAKLRHSGGCDGAPRALIHLMEVVQHSLQMRTVAQPPLISITDEALFNYHFVFMHGRHDFRLNSQEKRQLKTFVQRGGIVVADAICASPLFAKAFRREMRDVFDGPLTPVPLDHAILTDQYGGTDIREVVRREAVSKKPGGPLEIKERRGPPRLEGILVDDTRYGVIFSPLDLSCALERQASPQCHGYASEDAARIGINVILYSLHE